MKKRYDYYTDGEWRVCKPLTEDCKDIVGDLMNSVNAAHHWPKEKQQQYFERIISVTYDLATRKPKTKMRKFAESIKDKFFSVASRLVIYVP